MLILSYRFNNFYSFAEETVVDLTTTESKANAYTEKACGKHINRVAAFFGANGAGKTNILKPLAFIDWFTTESFRNLDAEEEIPLETHANKKNQPFDFEMEYCHLEEQFKYKLSIQEEKVLRETLKKKSNKTQKFLTLFDRKRKGDFYETRTPSLSLPKHMYELERDNCSLISYFISTEPSQKQFSSKKYKYRDAALAFSAFLKVETNIYSQGKKENTSAELFRLSENLHSKKDDIEIYESFIKSLDLGISKLSVKEVVTMNEGNEKTKNMRLLFAVHDCEDGSNFELPIFEESTGTQKILVCLSNILPAMINGSVAVVDELDSDLHPYMLPFILDIFSNNDICSNPGQLLFSAHTSEAMNELSKSQIFLVEKSGQTSEVYRADQVKGLRTHDNLYKKYISGAMGGIPELDSSDFDSSSFHKGEEETLNV